MELSLLSGGLGTTRLRDMTCTGVCVSIGENRLRKNIHGDVKQIQSLRCDD